MNPGKTRSAPKFHLGTTLVVTFVAQIAATVGLVGYLSFRSGQSAVSTLATQLRSELAARIEAKLRTYFASPHDINRLNANALARGELDVSEARGESLLWQEMQVFPNIAFIYCGSPNRGDFFGVVRQPETGDLELSFGNASNDNLRENYSLDVRGNRAHSISQSDRRYDARTRPWYEAAISAGGPVWSDLYIAFSTGLPNITASLPVYNDTGNKLIGVCGVDVVLPQEFRQFLQGLEIGESGEAFVIDRQGTLISSSTSEPLTVRENERQELIQATDSREPLVLQTTAFLQRRFGDFAAIRTAQQLEFEFGGERQFVQVSPLNDGRGIDWLIVVVVPESDFMGQINSNTRNTILLCLGALGLAIAIGILAARWIAQPILRVSHASDRLAQGDLDQQVAPSSIVEIDTLAGSFNTMAGQLETSFSALRQSEERFRGLVANIPGAVYRCRCDEAWTMEYISNTIETISGYPAAGLIQNRDRTYATLIHPDDRDLVGVVVNHGIITQEPYALDYRVLHCDGSIRWVYEQGQAIFDEAGNPLYLDGAIFDITERKAAEDALKQSYATNRALVEAIPDLLLRVRRDGTYMGDAIGPQRLQLFSGGTASFDQSNVKDSLPPKQAQQRLNAIQQALETGNLQIYEHRLEIDGKLMDEEVRVVAIGADEALIMARDITNRKRAEEALRIAEENYRSIFENALEGIFQSSPDGYFINVNPALAKIYGYTSPADMISSITDIGKQLYVDRSKRLEFQDLMQSKDTVKDFEYRCYCKDGSTIWTQIDARCVRDSDGNLLYYEGLVQNITERKQQEAELKRQLEELQIEIDHQKRAEEVAILTKSDYFQEVQQEIADVNLDEFWS